MLKGSRQHQVSVFQSILRSNLFLFFLRTDQNTYSQDGYLGNVNKNFKFMSRPDTSLDLDDIPFLRELTLNSSFLLCFLQNCEPQDGLDAIRSTMPISLGEQVRDFWIFTN